MKLILGTLLLLACQGPAPSTPPPAGAAMPESDFKPTLELTPMEATAAPGGTVSFSAVINYVPGGPRYPRQPVKWSVVEGEKGGTITRTGLYAAPGLAGVYHVRAEREDFPGVAATATVRVQVQR